MNREQRFFAYAAVAVEPIEADELVKRITAIIVFKPKNLRDASSCGTPRGERQSRRSLRSLVPDASSGSSQGVRARDEFFEYVFEPLVSTINSVFYEINFHKFVGIFCISTAGQAREGADAG